MCANFQPITQAQASRFTNQQLSFDFKDDIYSGYEAPLLFANWTVLVLSETGLLESGSIAWRN